jgi:hypothetical protein
MSLAQALLAELDDQALDRLAELLGPRLASRTTTTTSRWLNVDEAADHLRCSRQRIYDLTQRRGAHPTARWPATLVSP